MKLELGKIKIDDIQFSEKTYVENSGIYRLKEPSVNISDIQYITDNGGKWFENEVLDYMKYNLIDFLATSPPHLQ